MKFYLPGSHCLNSLWSLWYCLIFVSAEAYLVYRTLNRINSARNVYDFMEVKLSYFFVTLSILSAALFVPSAVFKLDNFAGDGEKMGKLVARVVSAEQGANSERTGRGKAGRLKKFWRHFLPVAPFLHVISAFSLLICIPILSARLLSQPHQTYDNLWRTEMDLIIGRRSVRLPLIHNSSGFALLQKMHATLSPSLPHAEFIFYIFGLLLCAVRYPTVFWFTNRWLSSIFAFGQFTLLVQGCFSYATFEYLYKVQANLHVLLKADKFHFMLTPGLSVAVYVLSAVLIFVVGSMLMFEYCHQCYYRFYKACKSRLEQKNDRSADESAGSDSSTNDYGRYVTNFAAMVLLIAFVVLRIPITLDCLLLYRYNEDILLFTGLLIDAIYILFWIITWLLFTLRQRWQFKIQLPYVAKKSALNAASSGSNRTLQNNLIAKGNHEPVGATCVTGRPFASNNASSAPIRNGDVMIQNNLNAPASLVGDRMSPAAASTSSSSDSNYTNNRLLAKRAARNHVRRNSLNRVTFQDAVTTIPEHEEYNMTSLEHTRPVSHYMTIQDASRFVPTLVPSHQPINTAAVFPVRDDCFALANNQSFQRKDWRRNSVTGYSPVVMGMSADRYGESLSSHSAGFPTSFSFTNGPLYSAISPETTLTRDYRSSVRSKCDQLFRGNNYSLVQPLVKSQNNYEKYVDPFPRPGVNENVERPPRPASVTFGYSANAHENNPIPNTNHPLYPIHPPQYADVNLLSRKLPPKLAPIQTNTLSPTDSAGTEQQNDKDSALPSSQETSSNDSNETQSPTDASTVICLPSPRQISSDDMSKSDESGLCSQV